MKSLALQCHCSIATLYLIEPSPYSRTEMDTRNGSQLKRSASPDSDTPTKKRKTKFNNATVDLNKRFANAMKDFLVTNLNESYRENCLKTLGVSNGSEAGQKIEALLNLNFKDKQKGNPVKENSEKINGNSS